MAASPGPPISQTARPISIRRRASVAKCAAGQRLAGPYSAPTQSATAGAALPSPKRASVAATSSGSVASRGAGVSAGVTTPRGSASRLKRSTIRGSAASSSRRASFSRP